MTTMCTSEKASWAYTHKHNFTTNATDDVIVVYLRRERDDMEMCVCARGMLKFYAGDDDGEEETESSFQQ